MNLSVDRRWIIPAPPGGETATIGELGSDWGLTGYTCEDEVRPDPNPTTPENEAKIPGVTAIPTGTFPLKLRWSNHFQRRMPFIDDVPGFTDVMVHGGIKPKDSRGCVLVGKHRNAMGIDTCKPVVDAIIAKLEQTAASGEPSFITIRDAFADPPQPNIGAGKSASGDPIGPDPAVDGVDPHP